MKSGRTQVEIIALYEELGSYRAVGALLGCDHKTVKRYVEAAGEAGQLAPALTRSRVTDDFAGLICERVEQTHGRVTARRLLRIVRAAGYPDAKTLTITADCGGSNGNRTRLWKTELQRLADNTGLQITVCHFPPGTSKWNKIEHRLFSFISMNWRAKPLISRQTVIDLIAATTTRTGLEVFARLDERSYPKGIKVSDAELAAVKLEGNPFHPEWNYTIKPSGN